MAKGQRKVASDKSAIVAKLPRACMDETAAVEFFEEQRWGKDPRCAHCESREIYQMRDRKTGERNKRYLWRCRSCNKQFTVRVNSVYEDSPIPMRCWALCILESVLVEKGRQRIADQARDWPYVQVGAVHDASDSLRDGRRMIAHSPS